MAGFRLPLRWHQTNVMVLALDSLCTGMCRGPFCLPWRLMTHSIHEWPMLRDELMS